MSDTFSQQPVNQQKKRGRGRPFQKGVSGNPGGVAKGKDRTRAPKLLADLRAVYEQPASADRGPGQKTLRKLLDSDPKAFLQQMTQLEKAKLSREDKRGDVPPVGVLPPCDNEARVETLIERLLGEMESKPWMQAEQFSEWARTAHPQLWDSWLASTASR